MKCLWVRMNKGGTGAQWWREGQEAKGTQVGVSDDEVSVGETSRAG